MPQSKKRKRKNGTVAKFTQDRYRMRRRQIEQDNQEGRVGVSLQDLINMVAYQEYQAEGKIDGPRIPDSAPEIDFEDPDNQAIITAVNNSGIEDDVNWGPVQAMIDAENNKKEQD